MNSSHSRAIDVRKQHRMSLAETWRLCIRGVRHRLFRSVLTLAVVVLAVAFFMFLLAGSLYERSVAHGVQAEDAAARFAQTTLTRTLSPATETTMVVRMAESGEERAEEFARVAGVSPDEVRSLAATARTEKLYSDWIEKIPTGKRIVLVGKATGRAAIRRMMADTATLHTNLAVMVDIRVPGGSDGLDAFLDAFPGYASRLAAFTASWNESVARAVAATAAATGGAPVERWLADAPDPDAEAWRAAMGKIGFDLPPDLFFLMRQQLRGANAASDVMDALGDADLRREWATAFLETKPSTPDAKVKFLDDPRAAKLLAPRGFPDATVLAGVARRHAESERLAALKSLLAPVLRSEPTAFGLTGRQLFLLAISFLVCMVGIANAMLMAITERFREIATMKCLGATDGYILSQFMMEAALQGFFGGLLGAVVGLVIATARNAVLFGSHLWSYFPGAGVAFSFAVSVAAGVLLSALASIQPSWSASRMAPMEAMRVE